MILLDLINRYSGVAESMTAVVEIVLLTIAIFTFRRDKALTANDYINSYNSQFIFNDDEEFKKLDRKLEAYAVRSNSFKNKNERNTYLAKMFSANSKTFLIDQNVKFDETGAVSAEYQAIVNYLVYLESITPMINQKAVDLEMVDDLFAYRFFIAFHNPVLQVNEILPEIDYYQGCIRAYLKWYKYHLDTGKKIPLIEHSIYDLLKEKQKKRK